MPYVAPQARDELAAGSRPSNAGELNYALTTIVNAFIKDYGLSYATVNSCVGVLECAKLELYRRIAAPYEDKKIIENGDVYT